MRPASRTQLARAVPLTHGAMKFQDEAVTVEVGGGGMVAVDGIRW